MDPKDNLTNYYFDREMALPALCQKDGTARTRDPEKNFEVLWHTFNEQYAFFIERQIDWAAQYARYRPQVNAESTDEVLFLLFKQMLAPLNDGHSGLYSATLRTYSAGHSRFWTRL